MLEGAKPLAFPVPFPDVPAYLVYVNVSRAAAAERLGPPTLVDRVEGLGTADFWAFEFPCGLQCAMEFCHLSEGGRVVADAPEVAHVLRHLPFPRSQCVSIDDEALTCELALLLQAFPERKAQVDALHSFEVWRQGDDGNPIRIGDATSERDASCLVKQLTSSDHKQIYWYSPVEHDGGTPNKALQQNRDNVPRCG